MDKLQPLITHRFWICLALALILPLTGWWMFSGSKADAIEQRISDLDGKFNVTSSGPNAEWVTHAEEFNNRSERQVRWAAMQLWEGQKSVMTWPALVRDRIVSLPLRSDPGNQTRSLYDRAYPDEIRRLRNIVDPYDPETDKGRIDFALESVPRHRWASRVPTAEEMWNAQEDVWLTTALLEAVARLNQDAESIRDAPLKRIEKLWLVGGSRKGDGGGEGGGEGGEEGEVFDFGDDFGDAGGGGAPRGSFGVRRGGRGNIDPDFPLSEEFGKAAVPVTGSAAQGADGGSFRNQGGMFGATRPQAGPTGPRYVDFEEDLPFKVRGFYISCVMDHQALPAFIAELSASPFPITIIRVHYSDLHQDGPPGRGGRGMFGRRGAFGDAEDFDDIDGDGGGGRTRRDHSKLTSALSDPYLTRVVIAGEMTIYKSPTEGEQTESEEGDGAAPTELAGGTELPAEVESPEPPVTDGADSEGLPAPAPAEGEERPAAQTARDEDDPPSENDRPSQDDNGADSPSEADTPDDAPETGDEPPPGS